jgi:formylglycine-generating enzyme required for sulfatase activity
VKLNSVTRPQIEPVPKGIVALFSCSAGQESYEWPDLEHGVFFHQILSGWNGAADTGDQELSLDELVAYTRKNTQSFARLKLGAVQTPQLKGEFNGTWVLRKLGVTREFTNTIGMTFKLIPAGEFDMGSSDADVQAAVRADPTFKAEYAKPEQPQHRVRITQPFYLGIHEVT